MRGDPKRPPAVVGHRGREAADGTQNDENMTKRISSSPVANATNASRTHMTAALKMLAISASRAASLPLCRQLFDDVH